MLTLVKIDAEQLGELYEEHLKRDFPPSELKRLSTIEQMLNRGEYEAIIAQEEGEMTGYALVYCPKESRMILLDYLAVEPQRRGQGLGTSLLTALKNHYAKRADKMLIECETPDVAPDPQEAGRRIAFYRQANARQTGVRIELFDVDYTILMLWCAEEEAQNIRKEEILAMYARMLPKALYMRHLRLIEAQ